MRSGSSFLGELFNVHRDAFYIYEPLYDWAETGCSDETGNERIHFLEKMMTCNFADRYDTRSSFLT